ncbi:MAG TPA: alpha-L-arabinofuranosidase C-terminal domain-containing protein [Candidatus Paceibacterota bacterium]|nr:alpha-L-arabinofuranosidase C-terminal domain-containing protein [Verrucomicrobiota bacterium]HSA08959.1 alpha-L-arabinofuranosidase C-terminal domain-containing protein [Candidatus Paceibacterota bacterium]
MRTIKQLTVAVALILTQPAVLLAAGPKEAALSLDLGQAGPAISPYIYGQFIEHLGRCIHDGIWAEKLWDRKFLLALDKSPWQVVRPAGAEFDAFLDPAGAYAGDHCLALWRRGEGAGDCGIVQKDIGVMAGKEYVGYAVIAAVSGEPAVEATLSWGAGADNRQAVPLTRLDREYRRVPFRFKAGGTIESASFSLRVVKPGLVWIGCVSLMPADNVHGMRADVLALIQQLNAPITRWPGGNFVSGYNWKDAIGERDRRPPRWERAWNAVEDNDFGLDEFMRFCAEVRTEPYIAVNTGLGSVQDAADEVEYATGSSRSRWGAERARNGQRQPYDVTWWGIGNEMYGNWQLGNVPVERYALRHNAFVAAMKAKNPRIKVIAVGSPGRWNDMLLPLSAAHMDLLSGHHYTQRKFKAPLTPEDTAKYEADFPTYCGSVMSGVRGVVADYRQRLGAATPGLDRVRLAVDEWGIVRDWNPAPDSPGVGAFEHFYPLGDALASARALHELIRSADLVAMANWAQTVNVIGAIKAGRNHAVLDPVGHLLALYRAHVGGSLVPARLSAAVPVDAVAALDAKNGHLSLGLVNYSASEEVVLSLKTSAGTLPRTAQAWRINGPSLTAINVPGKPESVTTSTLPAVDLGQPIRLPAHSITVLRGGR